MENLYKIKEALWKELEKSETARSGELKGGELEAIHKLTDTIKNIDMICMLEEESGYIEAVDGDDYGRGSSYAITYEKKARKAGAGVVKWRVWNTST